MRKRSPIPNPYRCLSGLRLSLVALALLIVLVSVESTFCARLGLGTSTCEALQAPYEWWLAAAVLAGIAYTAYLAWRDFIHGRYYSDLSKLQQQ